MSKLIDKKHINDEDDEWETDPDFINDVTEEQQRWGGARDTGVLDMNKLRQEIISEASEASRRKQEQEGYNYSAGYGGKFGVMTDRQDKSAVGWEYRSDNTTNKSDNNRTGHDEESKTQ